MPILSNSCADRVHRDPRQFADIVSLCRPAAQAQGRVRGAWRLRPNCHPGRSRCGRTEAGADVPEPHHSPRMRSAPRAGCPSTSGGSAPGCRRSGAAGPPGRWTATASGSPSRAERRRGAGARRSSTGGRIATAPCPCGGDGAACACGGSGRPAGAAAGGSRRPDRRDCGAGRGGSRAGGQRRQATREDRQSRVAPLCAAFCRQPAGVRRSRAGDLLRPVLRRAPGRGRPLVVDPHDHRLRGAGRRGRLTPQLPRGPLRSRARAGGQPAAPGGVTGWRKRLTCQARTFGPGQGGNG